MAVDKFILLSLIKEVLSQEDKGCIVECSECEFVQQCTKLDIFLKELHGNEEMIVDALSLEQSEVFREFPCCLCPAESENFQKDVCKDCGFVSIYKDVRGWVYFVRAGMGLKNFKTFYVKPNNKKQKGCTIFEWKDTFSEAQIELNKVAKERNWKLIKV